MAQANLKLGGDILVIDDDELLRDLVADWLEGAGYEVRKAPHCRAALDALADAPASLIVSDMFMPGACGASAIAALKRAAPSAPVIALSGDFHSGSRMSAKDALAAGAARALAKPVRRAELLGAVRELIGAEATKVF